MNLEKCFAAAPFEEGGWDIALKALATATRSSRGNLLALGDRHLRFNWITDLPDELLAIQTDIDGYRAETNYRIAVSAAPMELCWEVHYDEARAQSDFEPYIDYTRRIGGEHGAQVVLMDEPDAFFGLAVLRDERDGRTSEDDRRIFMEAAPHVLAAIRLQSALEHQGSKMVCGTLDAMQTAAVLLDSRGRVCGHTPAAEAILSAGNLFIANGRLQARRADLDVQLQEKIGAALGMHICGIADAASELWIPSPSDPILVKAVALPSRLWSLGYAPAVSVVLRAPKRQSGADPTRLVEALGLTPAEAEVAALLASGMSRQAVANARGTSIQTVVSQLRTVFQKCHVRREVELVGLVRPILTDPSF